MIRFWPILFIAIPLAEIYLFIQIGGYIGALNTVLIVLATAFIGVNLLRFQGISTLRRAQLHMAQGQMPAMEMMEGLVLAVGGALFITPGFLTDAIGLICLLPVTRRGLIRYLMSRASVKMYSKFQAGQQQTEYDPVEQPRPGQSDSDQSQAGPGRTIEGEYRRDD